MFYLELISGLRKGELVALQWSDLDEANCTISVSKQASWDTDGTLILSQPKTGNSIREVSIPQDAVELLKQEHTKHPDNPWMFPSSRTGEMYHPDSLLGIVFNGFCFINLIPHFFDYLMCPYYPAYTMGCYQIVIGGDNGG